MIDRRVLFAGLRCISLATAAAFATVLLMRGETGLADRRDIQQAAQSGRSNHVERAAAVANSNQRVPVAAPERGDPSMLRGAIVRRDEIAEKVVGLESILERLEATDWGAVEAEPTPRNCAGAIGPGFPDCPMAADSPEILRHLADCNRLSYDVPTHVFSAHRQGVAPPWQELDLGPTQQAELKRADEQLSTTLQAALGDAYRAARGVDAPPETDLSDMLTEIMRHTERGKAERWAYHLGALARLGEVSEDEIEDLPPIARAYVQVALAGDIYERSLAEVIGAEEARALRRRERGWGYAGVASGGGPLSTQPQCGPQLREGRP